MHFAALAYVGESVADPLAYYDNNTAGTISLLKAMKAAGVRRMVFSSTCATYGEPEAMPIVETMRQQPINPYGWSKWCVERVLRDYGAAEPEFAFVGPALFQRGGLARPTARWARTTTPETHLIPVLLQAALGRREKVTVFGTDYPTPDGTCIRDYIHVEDLCAAHIAAMEALRPGDARFYNLGIGKGYSVKEVIDSARRVTGVEIPDRVRPARGRAIRRSSLPTPRRFAASWAGRPGTPRSTPSWPRPGNGSRITPRGTGSDRPSSPKVLRPPADGLTGQIRAQRDIGLFHVLAPVGQAAIEKRGNRIGQKAGPLGVTVTVAASPACKSIAAGNRHRGSFWPASAPRRTAAAPPRFPRAFFVAMSEGMLPSAA